MGIIAGLALTALTIIGLYFYTDYKSREEEIFHYKDKLYSLHSSEYRERIKKLRRNETVEQIIKELESKSEFHKSVQESVKDNNRQEIWHKARLKKKNYIAFNNIELIKSLNSLEKQFSENQLEKTILNIYPQANVREKIIELEENSILKRNDKTNLFEMVFWSNTIYHPFELDETGKPKEIYTPLARPNLPPVSGQAD